MNSLIEKYARVLLTSCLKIEKDQPLFISANVERLDFVRIVASIAYELGVKDIYFEMIDPYLRHDALKNLEVEDLKKLSFWNREIWNEYAKKNAAFLMLVSETPGLMKDIDPQKQNTMTMYSYETRKLFDDLRDKTELAWCIAAVPTYEWAKAVFKDSINPVDELWDKIFDICGIKEDNPEEYWNNKINSLAIRAKKLNSYNFKKLIYKNSKGTDFSIELPNNHIWGSGETKLVNGKSVLVNFPTEEVFTSPKYDSANGIVYSSKPLSYHDVVINDFSITFKDGIAIDCSAKEGEEALKQMINSCENSNRLGEVALVQYSSPISLSNIVFQETLYDENASCHLALGASFPECIEGGPKMTKEELISNGLNQCDNHVDFMIGTSDLSIIGEMEDGTKVTIFQDGDFTSDFN